ncbi:hypothetical protein [Streptomyces sp. NBC_01235]|uniref:hypothetical protein n=1 Tax=Streptomyces sp. NBC_01235 TaxID=2903788 RepID=UPI002E129670|nr:hypothetical protein OG289_41920 [Streptomyces sp. NBC_01235]
MDKTISQDTGGKNTWVSLGSYEFHGTPSVTAVRTRDTSSNRFDEASIEETGQQCPATRIPSAAHGRPS